MAPLQAAKTLYMIVCLTWTIRFRPGRTMVVMTDENTLHRRMRRLRPVFQANPFLMQQLGGRIENLHIGEPTELQDMLLYLAWSNSAAAMADEPICNVFADEIALWEAQVGKTEIDALSHLRGRQNTFERDSKLVKVSSPRNVGDLMDTEFMDGDRCEYWVPCSHCSYWHVMVWYDSGQPGCHAVMDRDSHNEFLRPRDYETGPHVRYVCPSCGRAWTDYYRAQAQREGVWLPAGVTMGRAGRPEGEIKPTAYKSAHIHGLMVHPRLRSLGRMAADWVKAKRALKSGKIGPLKHFANNHEGKSWRDTQAETDVEKLKTHIGNYHSGHAPVGSQIVTVAVDVQVDHVRYAAFGWGYLYEGWLIEYGRIETGDTREISNYEQVRRLLVKTWPAADADGSMPASLTAIDSAYNTDVVMDFCRQNGGVIPVLGSPQTRTKTYSKVAIDHIVNRYDLNLLPLKDKVHRLLFVTSTPGGGYMHLPADLLPDAIAELCSEHKITKDGRSIWVPKAEHLANHLWDLAVYAVFAAMLAGVGLLGPYEPPKPKPAQPRETARGDGFLDGLPEL